MAGCRKGLFFKLLQRQTLFFILLSNCYKYWFVKRVSAAKSFLKKAEQEDESCE